jgi:uncharacterized protein (TIGR03000 family)
MYKYTFSVLAGLLAAAAFALTPGAALAQHHGGHGGSFHGAAVHHGGNFHGGNFHGGNFHTFHGDGFHRGFVGNRGWGWGWGGVGIGLGYYPRYGYGNYWPGYTYSTPYYYGDSDVYYDTMPYYYGSTYSTPDYDYCSAPAYGDMTSPVVVPQQDATVWFNGRMTNQTGTVRDFESPALTPGLDFSYDVKAQWRDKDGKEVTRTRHIDVRANSNVTVDFTNQ